MVTPSEGPNALDAAQVARRRRQIINARRELFTSGIGDLQELGAVRDALGHAEALCDTIDALRADLLTEQRRNTAAVNLIARKYCDDFGNPIEPLPDDIDKISDILIGIDDEEIVREIEARRAALGTVEAPR